MSCDSQLELFYSLDRCETVLVKCYCVTVYVVLWLKNQKKVVVEVKYNSHGAFQQETANQQAWHLVLCVANSGQKLNITVFRKLIL